MCWDNDPKKRVVLFDLMLKHQGLPLGKLVTAGAVGRKFLNDEVLLHEWRDRLHHVLGHIASTHSGAAQVSGGKTCQSVGLTCSLQPSH